MTAKLLSVSPIWPSIRPACKELDGEWREYGTDEFVVAEHIYVVVEIDDRRHGFYIHAGYITDGYSIPSLLRGFFSKYNRGIIAAIVHDYIYNTRIYGLTRSDADAIFRQAMEMVWARDKRVFPRSKIRQMYWGVRIGGGIPWSNNTAKLLQMPDTHRKAHGIPNNLYSIPTDV